LECRRARRFAPGDRSEDAVKIFSQRLCGRELTRVVHGVAGLPVTGQQSCGACPLEKVVSAGEVVSCEARPPVDRIDEIYDGMVTGEVEGPTRRDDDDRRTIPDQPKSEVSLEVLPLRDAATMLRAVPLARDVVHHSHTDVAHSVVASATWRATRVAGTPFAYCK
jgi:hypothetical protein